MVALQRQQQLRGLELLIRSMLNQAQARMDADLDALMPDPAWKVRPDASVVEGAALVMDNDGELLAALQRIEAGTYGLCERCGQDIELLRLWDQPHLRICRFCELDLGEHRWQPPRFVI